MFFFSFVFLDKKHSVALSLIMCLKSLAANDLGHMTPHIQHAIMIRNVYERRSFNTPCGRELPLRSFRGILALCHVTMCLFYGGRVLEWHARFAGFQFASQNLEIGCN